MHTSDLQVGCVGYLALIYFLYTVFTRSNTKKYTVYLLHTHGPQQPQRCLLSS